MIKAGLFGVGLDTYWAQFDGLLDNLKKYQGQIKNRIEHFGVEVIDGGMVDNPVKAREAADLFRTSDIEVLFLYVSTYALSSTMSLIRDFSASTARMAGAKTAEALVSSGASSI